MKKYIIPIITMIVYLIVCGVQAINILEQGQLTSFPWYAPFVIYGYGFLLLILIEFTVLRFYWLNKKHKNMNEYKQ